MGPRIKFHYRSATATLVPMAHGVYELRNVYSREIKQGHGRGVLNDVIRWADEHRMTILLTVIANGQRETLNDQELQKFYESFGFKEMPEYGRPVRMIRKPREKNMPSNEKNLKAVSIQQSTRQ